MEDQRLLERKLIEVLIKDIGFRKDAPCQNKWRMSVETIKRNKGNSTTFVNWTTPDNSKWYNETRRTENLTGKIAMLT